MSQDPDATFPSAELAPGIAHALFAQSPISVALYDTAGRVTLGNAAYERFFGIRVADVPAGWSVFTDPQLEAAGVLPLIRRAYGGEAVVLPPVRYDAAAATHAAGRTVWTQAHCYPLRDAEGAVTHVAMVHADVTGWAEAAEALRASEGRYRTLFESIDEGFCVLQMLYDAAGRPVDYRFVEVNPAFARQTGLRDAVGRTALELVPDLEAHWVEAYGRVAETGEAAHFRLRSDAMERWFDVHAFRVGRAEERQVALLFADVTAAQAVERERARLLEAERAARTDAEAARETAEAASRARSEFLATMSHEIRTPINAIVGYTQLLELGIPDSVTPAQRVQLGRVTASAQHLLGLVNDVLDVAKVDAGEMRVTREECGALSVLDDALALARPMADAQGVRVLGPGDDAGRGDAGRDAAAAVRYVGDPARVRQILVNLLSNAAKFTPAGGTITVSAGAAPHAPVDARVEGDGPWAYLRVADTGVGIAPDQQAAVFEPFVQAERGHTRTKGGTGLGLTISRRLARLMGGDLTLESVPGQGAAFTLWLPAAGRTASGETETADARGERAGLPGRGWRVHGLAEIGRALREGTDAILGAYTDTLRADPATPLARDMPAAQLEDHAITLLADLAQSLVIIDDAGADAAALMADGTAIQRTIAEHHGARRRLQGWSEDALRRDHEALRDAVERAVRARVTAHAGDVSEGLRVLAELHDRTAAFSIAAHRRAAMSQADDDGT